MKSPVSSRDLSRLRSIKGFSLVEVALAVGIFGFGMVGIMGLLPVGFTSFRESKARTVEASILQQRSSEVLQTPFTVLTNSSSPQNVDVTGLQFYTEQGLPIGKPQASAASLDELTPASFAKNAAFASRVEMTNSLDIGSASSTNVVRATIEIARLSAPSQALKVPLHVPNLGK